MKYHVKRSSEIKASLNTVRPLIANFDEWQRWSPWTIAEPECPTEVAGTPGRPGHKLSWDGEIIGSGTNILREATDTELVYDLEFLKPFKSKAVTAFKLEESAGITTVTWTMDSSLPFFLFFMVNSIKNWIGMDYDRGLRMLKEIAEKGEVKATTENKGVVEAPSFIYVGIRRTVAFADIGEAMMQDCNKLMDELKSRGVNAQHWVTLYERFDMKSMQVTFVAAASAEALPDKDLGSAFVQGEVKGGKALQIKHSGAYDFLGNAWSMGMMYLRAKKMKQRDVPFEYYHNNPNETAPERLETSVYFPLK